MNTVKTTKEHFKLFKEECQKWSDKLGLDGYELNFLWENLDDVGLDGASAQVFEEYHATLTLDTEINTDNLGDKKILEEIKQSAKHEMIHVLMGRFKNLALSRYLRSGELAMAEEEIVRKLEKLI